MPSNLKLVPDLVPRTSFFRNLRSLLKTGEWDTIRRSVYADAGHKCSCCGEPGGKSLLHCHEVWEYNEKACIQKLVGLICLCAKCHEVKHIGLAQIKGRYDQALYHMMAVNNESSGVCEKAIQEAFRTWKRRSSLLWKLDVAELERLLPLAKAKEPPSLPDITGLDGQEPIV